MRHLELAHAYWDRLVHPGDILIDATCGNGHDTLKLAQLQPSLLYAFDVQPEALRATQELLQKSLSPPLLTSVRLIQGCHSHFLPEIANGSVKLIVYNLGYLPGGDKGKTTQCSTTLLSVTKALELIAPGGAISITCYPGHEEGEREEKMIMDWAERLDKALWNCCHHRWLNRPKAPSLLLIERQKSPGLR